MRLAILATALLAGCAQAPNLPASQDELSAVASLYQLAASQGIKAPDGRAAWASSLAHDYLDKANDLLIEILSSHGKI